MVGIFRGSDQVSRIASRFFVCLVATVLLLAGGTAFAEEGKPDPRSDTTKIKIAKKKGRVDGNYSAFSRESRKGGPGKRPWKGSGNSKKKIPAEDRRAIIERCWAQTQDVSCLELIDPDDMYTLTGPLARAMAVSLVASLRFPAPKPIFGPDPNNNEWKMLAVGFPVWLWTEGPTTVSTSANSNGFTFQLSARWRSTTFHMGDGTSLTCTSMATYSTSVKPGTPSPNCGHIYTQPSLPKGKYQVRAFADWDVTWSVAGFSGVIPAYNEASASIPIGELTALNR